LFPGGGKKKEVPSYRSERRRIGGITPVTSLTSTTPAVSVGDKILESD